MMKSSIGALLRGGWFAERTRRLGPLVVIAVALVMVAGLFGVAWGQDGATVTAGEGGEAVEEASAELYGEVRARGDRLGDFAVDEQGTRHGQEQWLSTRLLFGARWMPLDRVTFGVGFDLLNDRIAGDTTDLGTARGDDTFRRRRDANLSEPVLRPRELYVQVDTNVGRVAGGIMTSSWGLGLLSSDGLEEPVFGETVAGNTSVRLLFATQPWARVADAAPVLRSWTFIVAGDWVIEDEAASRWEGDDAWGGVVATRIDRPGWSVGVLQGVRWQEDREDAFHPGEDRTQVRAFTTSLHAALRSGEPDERLLSLEGEAAFIAGWTDRPWLDETFEDGANIRSFGTRLRARWEEVPLGLTGQLDTGYASGDNDPRDGTARTFTFHRDQQVGLILFPHVLPLLAARSIDRVFDPGLLDVPPGSTRFVVPQGGVHNAFYLNPAVRWEPIRMLDVRAGWLMAFAAADLVDPYQSARTGGFNTTWGGDTPGSRVLGHELNAAIRGQFDLPAGLLLRPGVEGGVFLPGAAFDGLDGDGLQAVGLVRGLFDLSW